MSSFIKYALILTILAMTCQCQFFCGEVDHPAKVPKVTVANPTHLNVSWHGLFTDCTSDNIGHATVEVEYISDSSDTQRTFPADFDTKEALVELNPCLGYKIYISIHSKDGESYKDSTLIKYNDMARPNIERLYCGMLNEIMKQICLKKVAPGGVIWIPNPPEAIDKCILTRGDQAYDEFTAPGQNHFVPLEVLNPNDKQPMEITAMVNNIEMCPTATTPSDLPITTSPTSAPPQLGSVGIFIGALLGTAIVSVLITAIVCRFKKKKRSEERTPKVDTNADYGFYYSTAGFLSKPFSNSYFYIVPPRGTH